MSESGKQGELFYREKNEDYLTKSGEDCYNPSNK